MGANHSVANRSRRHLLLSRSRKLGLSETVRTPASLEKSRQRYLTRRLSESEYEGVDFPSYGELDTDDTPDSTQDEQVSSVDPTLVFFESPKTGAEPLQICVSEVQSLDSSCPEKKPSTGVSDIVDSDDVKKPERRVTFTPLGRYQRAPSFQTDLDHRAARINPEEYKYPFENLVFEGGGNKGLAYCGAVRYLEELGVMEQVKCFAGTSAGGMVATLLAVGYNSYEIEQFLSDRIDKIFLDASCGYCSLLPNLVRNFGWNPGKKILDWFGDKITQKTGDPDITFQKVYQRYGKKLCIVVTNLNQMSTEYCYPKTTPDMPIRLAGRMSMAIPGLFSATRYKNHGMEDVYVDGGVLCNYPVHCFDGWYLSMNPQDSFVRRLQPLSDISFLMEHHNRFGSYNDKTLGMLLYSDAEDDMLRMSLESRVGCLLPPKPDPETKLYVQRMKEAKMKRSAGREYTKVVQAVDSFLRVLKKHNIDRNDVIKMTELETAFKDEKEFPREQAEVLFGEDFTPTSAFRILDQDNSGEIHFEELVRFIEENGVSLQHRFVGYERRDIKNLLSFLSALQDCLTYNVSKLYVQERDIERTVGINTGHIHTTDFMLEEADREFVVKRGYNSMKSYLRYYALNQPDKVKWKFIQPKETVARLMEEPKLEKAKEEERVTEIQFDDLSAGTRVSLLKP